MSEILASSPASKLLLPLISREERQAIEQKIEPVMAEAERWCAKWSIFNPKVLIPASIHAIIHLPHLSEDATLIMVKCSLWNWALDDIFDNRTTSEQELADTVSECLLVAAGSRTAVLRGELARSLEGIRDELAAFPMFEAIYPFWAMSLSRALDGMAYEYWTQKRLTPLKFADPLPSLDEYLYFARNSVTVVYLWCTALILQRDDSFLPMLPELLALADRCALVIRLANDLSTFERELGEGGVNAVVVLVHELLSDGPTDAVSDLVDRAKADVSDMIAVQLAEAAALGKKIRSGTPVERRFVRATQFAVELYLKKDFRAWLGAFEQNSAMQSENSKQ